jgi:ankyrin repeat protein
VERLIAASADVDKAMTTHGSTPLFVAAQNGHTAIVAMLLKSGADKSIRGFRDRTPLEQAQRKGHAAVVALLAA